NELLECGINALAIAPSSDKSVFDRLSELAEGGMPIVTLNGDLPGCGRLSYVGMDHNRGGRVAAGLMNLILPDGGKVLPITAHLTHHAHKLRYTAFQHEMEENYHNIQLLPLQSCFNRNDFAYEIMVHAIEEHPDIKGVYVAANGTQGVSDAIADLGLERQIRVITFDLNDENRKGLKQGKIDIVIEQEPFMQGYRPAMMLYDHIIKGKTLNEFEYTAINICIKQMI
ncbi:MAG: substrate-binding domain-containing protein, partial [Butyricicoccaceae bacterium]